MTNLANLTTSQLKSIISIKEQIEALQSQIDSIVAGGGEVPPSFTSDAPTKGRRRMSAAGRARIAAAQRARWAKVKGKEVAAKPTKMKKDRRSSPATRAKLAAAAKARWAKAREAGKTTL
jgi:hypothetical protein